MSEAQLSSGSLKTYAELVFFPSLVVFFPSHHHLADSPWSLSVHFPQRKTLRLNPLYQPLRQSPLH